MSAELARHVVVLIANEQGNEDPTGVAPADVVEVLTAKSRAAPPPLPLGPEATALVDRVRFAMRLMLGAHEEDIEAVVRVAREHMPRTRR